MSPLCIDLSNIHTIKSLEDKSIFSASWDTFSSLFSPLHLSKFCFLPSLIASLNLSLIICGFSFVSSLLYMSKRHDLNQDLICKLLMVLSATAEMENFLGPGNFSKYWRNCFQTVMHQCVSCGLVWDASLLGALWDNKLPCHVELAVCQHEHLKVSAFAEDRTSFLLWWTAHLALKLWDFLWRKAGWNASSAQVAPSFCNCFCFHKNS